MLGAADSVSAKEKVSEKSDSLSVHFMDVGQGLGVLVESEGHYMMYDGGDRSKSSYVVSYLKKQGVKKLDYVFASHYDSDHLNGVIGVLNAFSVNHIVAPDYEHDSKLYTSFVKTVKNSGKVAEHPEVGDQYYLGSAVVTVLAPKEITDSSNDNSIAVKIEQGDMSFILTGDAEHESEEEMCDSGIDMECTVLCLGHHGSANSTSWDFLQETVPEYAVISCGEGNKYGHPAADTMEKLESMEIEVLRTDMQGTIVASTDGKTLEWNKDPCNDYTPGDKDDTGTQSSSSASKKSAAESVSEQNIPEEEAQAQGNMVWKSETGSKYHNKPDCGNMNPDKATQITVEEAESQGLEACKKCF
ncbi:MAG: MBL fold metallo-hydrolase [Clostridia bacterium]|nr:MBL fold metallo-hydrolase [Clostridia bacterium]NCC43926.1 MBL fold metallo-hydrolase [Clostridia bacterium]